MMGIHVCHHMIEALIEYEERMHDAEHQNLL